ncbi:hypothetical protein HAX54_004077, partial [Datura stramonium]|nr:hypothetical protein [Datura stramonium]
PLDDDEPTVLTDAVDDNDNEDNATFGAIQVDDTEDVDDQDFNLDDDDYALWPRKFFSLPICYDMFVH